MRALNAKKFSQSLEAVFLKLAYQSSQGEDEEASAEPTKVGNFDDLFCVLLDQDSYTVGPATKDQKKTEITKL